MPASAGVDLLGRSLDVGVGDVFGVIGCEVLHLGLLASAQALSTTRPSKVGRPSSAILAAESMTLPFIFTLARTGSQMKVASMSPRSQAAAISGGRMFTTFTSWLVRPAFCSAYMSW